MAGGRWNPGTRLGVVVIGLATVAFGVLTTVRYESDSGAAALVIGGLVVGLAGVAGGAITVDGRSSGSPASDGSAPAGGTPANSLARAQRAGDNEAAYDLLIDLVRAQAPDVATYHEAALAALEDAAEQTGLRLRPTLGYPLGPVILATLPVIVDFRAGTGFAVAPLRAAYHEMLLGPGGYAAALVIVNSAVEDPAPRSINRIGAGLDRPLIAIPWRIGDDTDRIAEALSRIRSDIDDRGWALPGPRRPELTQRGEQAAPVDDGDEFDYDADVVVPATAIPAQADGRGSAGGRVVGRAPNPTPNVVRAAGAAPQDADPPQDAPRPDDAGAPQDARPPQVAPPPHDAPPSQHAAPARRVTAAAATPLVAVGTAAVPPARPAAPQPEPESRTPGNAETAPAPQNPTEPAPKHPQRLAPSPPAQSAVDLPAPPGAAAPTRPAYDDSTAWQHATDLHWQGHLQEAESAYRAIIEYRTRAIGREDPDTLAARDQHATVLRDLDRLAEALVECDDVLIARSRILGDDDPDTLTSRSHLATIYHQLGDLTRAESEHQRVLEARTRVLGETNQETLISRSNLAKVYQDMGELDRAIEEHQKVMRARADLLGPEHRDTLMSRSLLASALHHAERLEEAEREHRQVLSSRVRLLGAAHLDTAVSRHRLASVLHDLGRFDEAIAEYRAAHDVYARLLGPSSPFARAAASDLAMMERSRPPYAGARRVR